jgi:hypothetical protein
MEVRIIHEKTGAVKFVAPHIANNTRLLKSYGYVKQDLPKKEEEPQPTKIEEQIKAMSFTASISDGMTEEQVREEYFKVFGKKPGNKKLETILNEIKETIQK